MDAKAVEVLAREAGLSRALDKFPDDVAAAAAQAADLARRLGPPADPLAEPWPPMKVGAPR
ncbi:MAG: hypothetical protein FJX02_02890 [Alphaproteobacteria bacterium]|nr:hypothetical protein [Alphaproteobacteria bacterium]